MKDESTLRGVLLYLKAMSGPPAEPGQSLNRHKWDSQKETVKTNVEAVNPNTTATIADDGTATVTYGDQTTATIPGSELVIEKTGAEKYGDLITVDPVNKNYGEATTEDDVKNAVNTTVLPADVTVTKTVDLSATLPDGNTAGEHTVPVTVEFPDGSSVDKAITVTVAKDTSTPSVAQDSAASQTTTKPTASDPKTSSKATQESSEIKVDKTKKSSATKKKDSLPETGEGYLIFNAAATSILAGLGLIKPSRKREDD